MCGVCDGVGVVVRGVGGLGGAWLRLELACGKDSMNSVETRPRDVAVRMRRGSAREEHCMEAVWSAGKMAVG